MISKYRHPKIVLLIGAVTTPPNLCIVMEYVKNGTLYDLIHKRKSVEPLSEKNKKDICLQLC
jgi:serine/threonine protein kinase